VVLVVSRALRWQVLQQVMERGKFMGMTIDGPHGRQATSHRVPEL
jgi:hypothetical protein